MQSSSGGAGPEATAQNATSEANPSKANRPASRGGKRKPNNKGNKPSNAEVTPNTTSAAQAGANEKSSGKNYRRKGGGKGRGGATQGLQKEDEQTVETMQKGIADLSVQSSLQAPQPFDRAATSLPRRPGESDRSDIDGDTKNGSDPDKGTKPGRRQMDTKLTGGADRSQASKRQRISKSSLKAAAIVDDNLTSRLTYSLRTPPYQDCPICYSACIDLVAV